MSRFLKFSAVSLICTVIAVTPGTLRADGCFVWTGYERLSEPDQKAIIIFDDGVEDLFLKVKYEGKIADFGWIIPHSGTTHLKLFLYARQLFACPFLMPQKRDFISPDEYMRKLKEMKIKFKNPGTLLAYEEEPFGFYLCKELPPPLRYDISRETRGDWYGSGNS